MQQGSETLNLAQALGVLRRRGPLIVLCIVVVAAAAFGFSKHQTKQYTATASLAFNNNQLSQQIAGLPPSSNTNLLAQQASNLELVRLGDMAAKTARLLGHGLTEAEVSNSLSIGGQGESSIVSVSATVPSPTLAAEIVNTYVHQFVEEQQSGNHHYFKSALALVNKELDALSPQQRIGQDGLALQNRAQTLRLLSELKYGTAQVAGVASPPTEPSSPKVSRNALVGGVLGLLLGLGLTFLLERLDRRIREPEEFEAIYHLPLLGIVSKSATLARRSRAPLPASEIEAFDLIRAHLHSFNVDRELRTVLIVSAAAGEGTTTIARRLAAAAARMGSRVLLLEADLRRPTLAQQLDIQPGPGLTDVLTGAIPMDEATQSIDLEAAGEGPRGRTLDVLAAGTVLPSNPGELIESEAMEAVLKQAESTYDFVVIDTPPLTTVSDAFPLLWRANGVVIVGWAGRSRRDVAERLHQILLSSRTSLLGIVANGCKSGSPSSYTRDDQAPPILPSANGAAPSDQLLPTAKA